MAYAWGLATGQNVFDVDAECDTTDPTCVVRVEAPVGLIPDPQCHARLPEVSAGCEAERTIVLKPTTTIRYPPPYYIVVGAAMRLATGLGVAADVAGHVGRLAGALLSASVLAPAFALVSRRSARLLPFLIASITPITLFVIGSVNPSGTEITGAIAASAILALALQHGSFDSAMVGAFVYATFWLAWSRPLGFLWAGSLLLFGALYLHIGFHSDTVSETAKRVSRAFVGGAVVTFLSMIWFGYSIMVRSTGAASPRTLPDPGIERLLAVILRWGDMVWESVGVLGWLHTPLSMVAMLAIIGSLAGMMVLAAPQADGLARTRGVVLRYLALVALGVTLIMIRTNFLWQGRYVIPTFVSAFILLGGTAPHASTPALNRLAKVAWVTSSSSVLWVLSRYVYGLDIGSRYVVPNFSDGASWTPTGGFVLAIVLGIVSIVSIPVALARSGQSATETHQDRGQ